ncbi:mitotic checkpoint serine/threonine-protein kinase BUB1 beta isoform X2 [Gadus morhua]|uniref:Uncharacterized protein n=1 Tax=Gadus morhua TaxID=8049 RepID=A0A8C5A9T0_GADMO|nr:mitotic checkpoint serine/threonine-protein kinase BUB1 beta-like isoform X2 [Gadus morhua]
MAGATRGRQPCKGITLPPQVKLQAPTVNEGPPNFPDVCDALQAEMHQQRHSVQARLPGEGGTGEGSSPPRINQVDLRPRGRKRLAESAGCSVGVKLQLPSMAPRAQSLPLQGPGAPAPEDPPTSSCPGGNVTYRDLQEKLEAVQLASCDGASASMEENTLKERSMYCKELLTQGKTEFCFEELRAERYTLARRQEVYAKIRKMDDLEVKLKQELQEKQGMLLLRMSLPETPEQVDEARNLPVAEPFHIFTDPTSGSSSSSSSAMPFRDGRASPKPLKDDVFLRPGEQLPSLKMALRSSGSGARLLSLTETVVGTVQNKTLCSCPDNTQDFAGSAHLVSTPYVRRAPPSDADHQGLLRRRQAAAPLPPQTEETPTIKLSPIKEASLEAHTTLSTAGGASTLGVSSTDDPLTPQTGEGPLSGDPCSRETRRRLLDQAEVSSFPGYHTVEAPLPPVDKDTHLSLGGAEVSLYTKVQEEEGFSLFGGFSQRSHVLLKVERSLLPWDFYVLSQLRRRLSPEDSAALPSARCFLFQDACVTLYTVPNYQKLSARLRLLPPGWVSTEVTGLLLMMRTFHSSSLLLGALHTDSLLITHGDSLVSVDLLSSLDLELQTDLTSAAQVPAALDYIQLGLLKPTDSPYQVDLVCLAEAVHLLLTKRKMTVVKEKDGWMVEKLGRNGSRLGRMSAWRKAFHLLLNSSGHSSVSVLSQLLDLVATAPYYSFRDEPGVTMAI